VLLHFPLKNNVGGMNLILGWLLRRATEVAQKLPWDCQWHAMACHAMPCHRIFPAKTIQQQHLL
jgi:hypothetical protein